MSAPNPPVAAPVEDSDLAIPTIADVYSAAARIEPVAHRTPMLRSRSLDAIAGAILCFKAENFQRTGSFKFRGAANAVMHLDDVTAARGVAAHSSGNHAAALALAATQRGIPVHIVMPTTTLPNKRAAVLNYGARVIDCAPTLAAREQALAEVVAETGAVEIHPYDNPDVIAGAATAALELHQETRTEGRRLDLLFAPVGGGGLLSGTAIATAGERPGARILGGEPDGAADAARSVAAGVLQPSIDPHTIADGLLTGLSPRTFHFLQAYGASIVTVSDAETIAAMRLAFERLKVVIEPSAAVALAAALQYLQSPAHRPDPNTPTRVGVILSGGNADLDNLPF